MNKFGGVSPKKLNKTNLNRPAGIDEGLFSYIVKAVILRQVWLHFKPSMKNKLLKMLGVPDSMINALSNTDFDNMPTQYKSKLGQLIEKYAKTDEAVTKTQAGEMSVIQKKDNGKWGIISNKTGEFWKANYDTKEKAQAALKAYHVHSDGLGSDSIVMESMLDEKSIAYLNALEFVMEDNSGIEKLASKLFKDKWSHAYKVNRRSMIQNVIGMKESNRIDESMTMLGIEALLYDLPENKILSLSKIIGMPIYESNVDMADVAKFVIGKLKNDPHLRIMYMAQFASTTPEVLDALENTNEIELTVALNNLTSQNKEVFSRMYSWLNESIDNWSAIWNALGWFRQAPALQKAGIDNSLYSPEWRAMSTNIQSKLQRAIEQLYPQFINESFDSISWAWTMLDAARARNLLQIKNLPEIWAMRLLTDLKPEEQVQLIAAMREYGIIDENMDIDAQIKAAELATNVNPTEQQIKNENYAKGSVNIQGLRIIIENPKGSIRSGKDASGKEWSSTMNNTYGYISKTESKDNDCIDIFLGSDPESEKVFVIDQVNKDKSFDEHKVMIGFDDIESAKEAYLSNYEEGWTGLGDITEVSMDDFKKWALVSKQSKPFAQSVNEGMGDQPLFDDLDKAAEKWKRMLINQRIALMGEVAHRMSIDTNKTTDEKRFANDFAKKDFATFTPVLQKYVTNQMIKQNMI